jgi:hypothetical protein
MQQIFKNREELWVSAVTQASESNLHLENTIFKSIACMLFLLAVAAVKAEDLSSCTLKTKADEMNYCKASFAGSATFCDMIKNGELKRDCYFLVIRVQRNNAYQLKKTQPESAEKE